MNESTHTKPDLKSFPYPIYVTRPLLPDVYKISNKIQEIWDAQWLTNVGNQHRLLEEKLQDLLKVSNISLFNNGTTALIVACQGLRLSGDVITTPFTFAATPHALTWNKLRPVFCDIDPVTMNIDTKKIESMITPQTTAILAVHVFGTPCDVDKIQNLADQYGLKVIYDAAHAFQCEIGGVGIGNFGDITMFSFHATKLFHTAEGGALASKDPDLKERIDLLQNFGIKNEEEVIMPGINGKMNEIQAALGLVILDYIEEERNKRNILRNTYRECLEDVKGVSMLDDRHDTKSSYQYFTLRINKELFGRSRDFVHQEFKKYNVFTRKYFYPLCSKYTCYHQLPSSTTDNLPVANKVAEEILAMPFYGRLSEDDVMRICNILKSFKE